MKQIALSYYGHPYLIIISLIIFIAFFIGLILWVQLKSNKQIYKELEKLPLEEEEDNQ